MKWLTVGVLAVTICLPLFVIFSADDMYNKTQDTICRNSPGFTEACQPYADRYSRTGIVSTAFYRHISSLAGRTTDAEPAFIDKLRQDTTTHPKLAPMLARAEQKLSNFTRNFAIALGIASALAGAALLYSIQRIHRLIVRLKTQPVRPPKKRTSKPKVTRSIKTTTGNQTTTRSRRTSSSKRLNKSLTVRTTKSTTKPKRPETIRPRASN